MQHSEQETKLRMRQNYIFVQFYVYIYIYPQKTHIKYGEGNTNKFKKLLLFVGIVGDFYFLF